MKRLSFCILILLSGATLLAQEKKPFSSERESPHRYALVSCKVPSDTSPDSPRDAVFLLDLETGRVWKYVPPISFKEKDGTLREEFDESFKRVNVDGLDGWDRHAALGEELRRLGLGVH